MPSNQTPNYQLSQWERDDKIQMEDFNADNAKIDAALKAQAATCASLQTLLNKNGNCSVGTFTYQGTGKSGGTNPTVVKFPRMPTVFMILGKGMMIGQGGSSKASMVYSSGYTYTEFQDVSWSGPTLSFYSTDGPQQQLNLSSMSYLVVYFCAES